MFYTYILESLNNPEKTYIGYTTDLDRRLKEHNGDSDKSLYSKKYKPWKIKTFISFEEEIKALEFEKYLKTGSGKSFIKRHVL